MSELFKYLGIAVVVAFADALICLGFTFTMDVEDSEKWLPTLVLNCLGFVACLTDIPITELYDILEQMPTADVVEVVRRNDCRYWKTETDPIGIECEPGETAHYCDLSGMITRTADFCNYGERRDDGEIH